MLIVYLVRNSSNSIYRKLQCITVSSVYIVCGFNNLFGAGRGNPIRCDRYNFAGDRFANSNCVNQTDSSWSSTDANAASCWWPSRSHWTLQRSAVESKRTKRKTANPSEWSFITDGWREIIEWTQRKIFKPTGKSVHIQIVARWCLAASGAWEISHLLCSC